MHYFCTKFQTKILERWLHLFSLLYSKILNPPLFCVLSVQLVRLLFWNRHSTEPRVDLDDQPENSATSPTCCSWCPSADTSATAAAARSEGFVNTAYQTQDDDTSQNANAHALHRHDGRLMSLSVTLLNHAQYVCLSKHSSFVSKHGFHCS